MLWKMQQDRWCDVQKGRLRLGIFFPFSKSNTPDIKLETPKPEQFYCCLLFTSLNHTKQHSMSYIYVTDVKHLQHFSLGQ